MSTRTVTTQAELHAALAERPLRSVRAPRDVDIITINSPRGVWLIVSHTPRGELIELMSPSRGARTDLRGR